MYEFVKTIEKVSLKETGTVVGSCLNLKGSKHTLCNICKCKSCKEFKAKQAKLNLETQGE